MICKQGRRIQEANRHDSHRKDRNSHLNLEKFLLKVVGDTGMQREEEENAGSII